MSNSMKHPAVSIIICTYMRASLLQRTLLSLENVLDIEQAEVIVVDNHSLDDTAIVTQTCMEQLKHKVHIRYLFEPKQGLSVARNKGIERSKAPIVAFLDDDAIPCMNWISTIRQAFAANNKIGAIGGIIQPEFEHERPDWLFKQLEHPYTIVHLGEQERSYPRRLAPFGANMAIRRDAIGKLRFPEALGRKGASLLSGEETWFFNRLRKDGWQLRYIPGMTVRHFISAERLQPEWIRKRYYYQGVSLAKEGKGVLSMIRIVTKLGMRKVYNSIYMRFAKTPGERMLSVCRNESLRGAFGVIRGKGVEATYD